MKKKDKKDVKKKKKLVLKKKKLVYFIFLLVLVGLLLYSGLHIVFWFKDNDIIAHEVEELESNDYVEEVEDDNEVELVNPEEDKDSLYWQYIKTNLINVDFDELIYENNQTVGWIQVGGTNINYPFVQAPDNEYYLNHSFYRKVNGAGWVFMDYRNSIKNIDKNTILYAHGRIDKTMFGTLKNVFTNGWLNDPDNYIVKLSTKSENTLWQVFSVYKIPTTTDYLQVTFDTNDEFNEFANMLLNRSEHDFKTSVNGEDYILTLSTCYNDNVRVVMHAKLIKKASR